MQRSLTWLMALLLIGLALSSLPGCRRDPCETVTCQNGGACIEGDCECPEGFQGEFCESFESSEFLGTYAASYGDCFDVPSNHTVDIVLGSSNDSTPQLNLLRLGDYGCPNGELAVAASVSLNQLTIPQQQIDCGGVVYNFSGSGELNGSRLTLTFTNRYDAGGIMREDVCTAILEKRQ